MSNIVKIKLLKIKFTFTKVSLCVCVCVEIESKLHCSVDSELLKQFAPRLSSLLQNPKTGFFVANEKSASRCCVQAKINDQD